MRMKISFRFFITWVLGLPDIIHPDITHPDNPHRDITHLGYSHPDITHPYPLIHIKDINNSFTFDNENDSEIF